MKSWLREVGVILLETKPPGSSKKDWKAVNCSTRKFCTSPGSAWFLLTQNDFTEGLKHQWSSTWQLDTIFFGMDYMVTFTINIPQMLAYIQYMDPMVRGYLMEKTSGEDKTYKKWLKNDSKSMNAEKTIQYSPLNGSNYSTVVSGGV